MKKLNLCLICLCVALGCVGCSNNTPEPAEPQVSATQESDTVPETAEQLADNTGETSETEQNSPIPSQEVNNMAHIIEYLNSESFTTPEGFDKIDEKIAYGEITEGEYYSTTTEAVRKFNIYTPPYYDENNVYPVLYLLHGIGGTHREWMGGKPNEIISNLIATGDIPPIIVVMPNIRAKQNDTDLSDMYGPESIAAFDNFINDLRDNLIPFINENYPVSANREDTMIAGLSMGGREALFIGVSMPETFGYIGAFCPAPGLITDNLGVLAQIAPENLTIPDEYKSSTFILINTGNSDGIVGDNPLNYYETLRDNGAECFFYSTDGGHDFNVWKHGLYFFLKSIFI